MYEVAHMTSEELIHKSGLAADEFAEYCCIPTELVHEWVAGERECNKHLLLMLARDLGMIERWKDVGLN